MEGGVYPYVTRITNVLNVESEQVILTRATENVHTITVFDGSGRLADLDTYVYASFQRRPVNVFAVRLWYDVGAVPDGPGGDNTEDRSARLRYQGGEWVAMIDADDDEIVDGAVVNMVVVADGRVHYQEATTPWSYTVRALNVQDGYDTISLENLINPEEGQKTWLEFELGFSGHVNVSVFNVRGEMVRSILNQQMDEGKHLVEWDGLNDSGNVVAIGLYYLHLESEGLSETRKVVVVK